MARSDDDDIGEYLDPELDPTTSTASQRDTVPGPLSFTQYVGGLHVLFAAMVIPFVWMAYQGGNTPQLMTLIILIGLILITGVAATRIARRRE